MWPTSGGHSELPLPIYTGHLPSLRHTPASSLDQNYGDDFSDVGSVYSSHLVDPGLTVSVCKCCHCTVAPYTCTMYVHVYTCIYAGFEGPDAEHEFTDTDCPGVY